MREIPHFDSASHRANPDARAIQVWGMPGIKKKTEKKALISNVGYVDLEREVHWPRSEEATQRNRRGASLYDVQTEEGVGPKK